MALDQRNHSKLMWIIVGGLVTIVSLAVFFLWYTAQTQPIPQNDITQTPQVSQTKIPTLQADPEVVEIDSSDPNALVQADILKEQVPQNATLAQEEIAKLDEIQKQLEEQLETIEAQQADVDQLIQLKEDQIKLLEEQLAQS